MGMNSTSTSEEEEKREHLREMEAGREFMTDAVYGDGHADDYWKRFLQTGSVSDYLKYTASYVKGLDLRE